MSRSLLSLNEMFQTKVVEKIKTHIVFSNFTPPGNRAVYEKKWKNMVRLGRSQMMYNTAHALCMSGD